MKRTRGTWLGIPQVTRNVRQRWIILTTATVAIHGDHKVMDIAASIFFFTTGCAETRDNGLADSLARADQSSRAAWARKFKACPTMRQPSRRSMPRRHCNGACVVVEGVGRHSHHGKANSATCRDCSLFWYQLQRLF